MPDKDLADTMKFYRRLVAEEKLKTEHRCPVCKRGAVTILSAKCQLTIFPSGKLTPTSFDFEPETPAACTDCDWIGTAAETRFA